MYYEALKYAPRPVDVQNMSLIDLMEFVGQKRRFYAEQSKTYQPAGAPNDSGHYLYSPEKRCEIAAHWLREKHHVTDMGEWAQRNYNMSSKTLQRYVKELQEGHVDT